MCPCMHRAHFPQFELSLNTLGLGSEGEDTQTLGSH